MPKKRHVETCEECFICGSPMTVVTTTAQDVICDSPDCTERHLYHALDGDKMFCSDCGAVGYFSADGESMGHMSYDDGSAHNVKCAEEYDKKSS